jgi:hypothetical protein
VLAAAITVVACATRRASTREPPSRPDAPSERARLLVDEIASDIGAVAPCLARALPDAPRLDLTHVPTRVAEVRAISAWVEQARGHRFAAPPDVRFGSRAQLAAIVASITTDRDLADAIASVSDATSDGRTITVGAPAGSAPLSPDTLLALVHELDRLLIAPGLASHATSGDDASRARTERIESDATIVTAVFARAAAIDGAGASIARRALRLAALPPAVVHRLLRPYTAALGPLCARAPVLTPSALDGLTRSSARDLPRGGALRAWRRPGSGAQAMAPAARSSAMRSLATPQSARASSVCCPGQVGGPWMAPGVRLKRGDGAGCGTPSTSTNVPRATLWSSRAASLIVSTGA